MDEWWPGSVEVKEGPGVRGLRWTGDVESVVSGAGMDVWEAGSEVVEPELMVVGDQAEARPGLVTLLRVCRPGTRSLLLLLLLLWTLTSPSCCSSFTS